MPETDYSTEETRHLRLTEDGYNRCTLLVERAATLVRAATEPADEKEAQVLLCAAEDTLAELHKLLTAAEPIEVRNG